MSDAGELGEVRRLRLRSKRLTWREVDGELVVLDLQRSSYLASNRSAALLWKALADGATREGLIDVLASTYGVDRAVATRDIDEFVDELDSLGLLEE